MFESVAGLVIRRQTPNRVVLGLHPISRVLGAIMTVAAVWVLVALGLAGVAPKAMALSLLSGGGLLLTFGRKFDFNREAGTLEISQRVLWIKRKATVPLFHIRAVIVRARGRDEELPLNLGKNYVAILERRVGEPLFLDESKRCARLLALAEAISETIGVRLEYDATQQMANH